ncbi:hypothetical protein Vau01_083630 [Virgisporangium aurantiacum]|uniref:Uncharacterized protein n=1 Tax=Virgisporangium aurantiacum TaxID=175570 RepID=A0A8J3ZDE8_9ACTN|nr:hypothetical protein Vau01_083630 [Virgisporangium aurantiacum]
MDVDEPRAHDPARHVAFVGISDGRPDRFDAAVADEDVGVPWRRARPVDDQAAGEEEITGHFRATSMWNVVPYGHG